MEKKNTSVIKSGLRSIAASFPGAASLAQAWNEYETKTQFVRIEKLFVILKTELESLKEEVEKSENYILNSGEIPSLIERTVEKIRREKSEERCKLFAHLLAKSLIDNPSIDYEEKISFIETLDILTTHDIEVLSLFESNYSFRVDRLLKKQEKDETQNNSKLSDLIVSLTKLEARGLVFETSGREFVAALTYFGEDPDSWKNRWVQKYFELSLYGVSFCEMVT